MLIIEIQKIVNFSVLVNVTVSYFCDTVCLTFSGPIYCYCHYICARVNKNKTRLERCWENILCLQCSAHICDMCCLLVKSFAQIKKTTKLKINLHFRNHVHENLETKLSLHWTSLEGTHFLHFFLGSFFYKLWCLLAFIGAILISHPMSTSLT